MIPDYWCVTVDMGLFDLIILESESLTSCLSYVDNCQHLYKDPLVIMLHSQIRVLMENWQQIEFCTGATIREPEKIKS